MNESNANRDELEDRLIDQALGELLGGQRPPDLSQQILRAAEAVQPVRTARWRPRATFVLAASLLVTVSGGVAAYVFQRSASQERAEAVATAKPTTEPAAVTSASLEAAGDYDRSAPASGPAAQPTPGFDFSGSRPVRELREELRQEGQRPARTGMFGGQAGGQANPFGNGMGGGFGGMGMPGGGMVGGGLPAEVGNGTAPRAKRMATEFDERDAAIALPAVKAATAPHPAQTSPVSAPSAATPVDMGGEGFADKKAQIEQSISGLAAIKANPNPPNAQYDAFGRPIAASSPATRPEPSQSALVNDSRAAGLIDKDGDGVPDNVTTLAVSPEREAKGLEMLVTPRIIIEPEPNAGQGPGQGGDRYSRIVENPFLAVTDNPLSTFSIDVDTASYSKTRRYLMDNNTLPPPDAVRIEELVNYFSYDYSPPTDETPFAAHVEVAACPWRPEHRLVRIGLKGKEIARDERPAGNLVFLLDVSGSMQPADKLPRVIRSMRMLVEQLGENDRVAIVVYAGASGLVLPSTPGYDKAKILDALDSLHAGGSTNGGQGIRLAYDTALASFIRDGTNRVILCTDGDFNVGTTSTAELERLAEERAKTGVFLTVLGYGMGNHNDDMLEKLADKGNGNYGYIDTEEEARKLLVDQLGGTLVTIAKDVKIQIEFNPRQVGAYRLIGYENRMLRAEDFNDDKKDAGEIGAGHTVTALYETAPPAAEVKTPEVDALRYQQAARPTEAAASSELLTLKLRYKEPDGQESKAPLVFPISDSGHSFGQATADFKFAAAVAGFGMLLRDSAFKGNLTSDAVLEIAQESLGADQHGYRAAFIEIVRKAKALGK